MQCPKAFCGAKMDEESDSYRCWQCSTRIWKDIPVIKPMSREEWRGKGYEAQIRGGKIGGKRSKYNPLSARKPKQRRAGAI